MKNAKYGQLRNWKTGILIFLALVLIGFLIGGIIPDSDSKPAKSESVQSVTMRQEPPLCAILDTCSARYTTARQGARHYRLNHMGHAGRVHYNAHYKKIILDKFVRVQNRMTSTDRGMSRIASLSRAGLWSEFIAHDTCVNRTVRTGSLVNPWKTTCQSGPYYFGVAHPVTKAEIHAYICGGLLGIAVGGAIETGGGSWVFAGIFASAVACQWHDQLVNMGA